MHKFPIKICFVLFSRILIKLWSLLSLIVLRSILGDFFLIFWKKTFKLVQNTRRYSTCVTFEGLNFNWCLCNKCYHVRLKTFTSTRLHIKVTNIIQNSFLKYTAKPRPKSVLWNMHVTFKKYYLTESYLEVKIARQQTYVLLVIILFLLCNRYFYLISHLVEARKFTQLSRDRIPTRKISIQ